ncbi:UDP-N-acetylmuramate--L-alanine ligase [candidate division LCP-89 bacterium B3_LCP]|uniref:UDP-N-acetylmuramate--L-alanine ligase n=1 Tax=candidate division LCP-89 bacterium B3_LCP TaxID=2012998 RepID=A0A532V2P6_UNCL8|nr:MAG: UDP-N-acetylmuramate--L-alanine ligase [candidate division LCP-89 bacterium B3_LCP]
MFLRLKNLHFIGIGGIGMSGIAEVLLNQGFSVSGSDLMDSETIDHLRRLGADVHIGHAKANVRKAQVVVYSSAVKPDNVEYIEAKRQGVPIIARAEMLSELMRMKYGIAVAGTHGKTTTTSMVAAIMTQADLDPTFIVGGKVKSLATNARLGSGEFLVAEADEYDRSFLKLTPAIAIITTLETEHLDTYGNLAEIRRAFVRFTERVPFYGSIVLCLDEPVVASLISDIRRPVITYGIDAGADISAVDISFSEMQSTFDLIVRGDSRGKVTINQPGLHNVKNALAAIGVAEELEIAFDSIQKGLSGFRGVERRFEIKGQAKGVMVVDDYAHHPTEVRATLAAARNGFDRRIIAVFQPHLFSRTKDFTEDFGRSFSDADVLIVTDIYAAREEPIPGVNGELIADAAKNTGHENVLNIPEMEDISPELSKIVQSGDMVITLGAGNIWKVARDFLKYLEDDE